MWQVVFFSQLFVCIALTIPRIPRAGFPPSARTQHSAVYSSALNLMIVFGGKDSLVLNNDIWAYNFTASEWILMYPLTVASPGNLYAESRRSAAMYITSEQPYIVYLYGGVGSFGPLNDLWSFNLLTRVWFYEQEFTNFFPLVSFAYDFYTREGREYLCIYGGVNVNRYTNQLNM